MMFVTILLHLQKSHKIKLKKKKIYGPSGSKYIYFRRSWVANGH